MGILSDIKQGVVGFALQFIGLFLVLAGFIAAFSSFYLGIVIMILGGGIIYAGKKYHLR